MQLDALITGVRDSRSPHPDDACCSFDPKAAACSSAAGTPERGGEPALYQNRDANLGIDFEVTRLPFTQLQVMDPRLVRIAPGASNEKHRHAHESIFVVLSGRADIEIGAGRTRLEQGQLAYVPRWVVHQSHNLSSEEPLLLLAITDFGLTSAVLGDYDASTRLRRSAANPELAAATSEGR